MAREGDSLIEVVLLDCDRATAGSADRADLLAHALGRLGALGVDVVLHASGPIDDVERLGRRAQGPGRLFVWSSSAPEVLEVGPSGSTAVATPYDSLPGRSPAVWARRQLVGAGGPDSLGVVTEIAGLDAIAAALSAFPTMVGDAAWRLEVNGFDPRREGDVEAWMTVGNGRSGTRGSLEEGREESSPGVFVAGVFGGADDDPDGPELAKGPEWTRLHPQAAGESVDLDAGSATEHRRVLDLRQAVVFRTWRQELDSGGRWNFRSARFASLCDREVMALLAEARVDGADEAAAVSLGGEIPPPASEGAVASVETRGDDARITFSVEARHGGTASFAIASDSDGQGRLERLVAVERTAGADGQGATGGAEEALDRGRAAGMSTVHARHRRAWRDRWRHCDVVVDGDAESQEALRFSLYHLISAADPESDLASVGARAMTGPGYRGHVFWDTEIFVLPFFTWTHPATARALLAYRYRTLPGARAKAARLGYGGALYPWESADTGDEVTPETIALPDGTVLTILTGLQEHHISADVAWAAWHHWQVTADHDFLVTMGAEMIVETARFWVTRARVGDDGRHHIDEVIGPDEYHEGVDDNAYTNVMARWNLRAAVAVCDLVPKLAPDDGGDLRSRLGIGADEIEQWEAVAANLVDGFDPDSQLYEQYEGFFDLENIRAVDLAPRPFTGEMVVGVDRLRHTQVVKQADVLMLAHMLPGAVGGDVALANYRYYEPRTCHGSSLSPAIHAAVAARVGALDEAMTYFQAAAGLDLRDHMGNAAKGVHIATMGGLWQAAVFGFGGVQPESGGVQPEFDGVRIDPRLPRGWDRLAFPVRWRGTLIDVDATADTLRLHLDGPARVAIGGGASSPLPRGSFVAVAAEGGGWSGLERVPTL